jgi:hypothetical protein
MAMTKLQELAVAYCEACGTAKVLWVNVAATYSNTSERSAAIRAWNVGQMRIKQTRDALLAHARLPHETEIG